MIGLWRLLWARRRPAVADPVADDRRRWHARWGAQRTQRQRWQRGEPARCDRCGEVQPLEAWGAQLLCATCLPTPFCAVCGRRPATDRSGEGWCVGCNERERK